MPAIWVETRGKDGRTARGTRSTTTKRHKDKRICQCREAEGRRDACKHAGVEAKGKMRAGAPAGAGKVQGVGKLGRQNREGATESANRPLSGPLEGNQKTTKTIWNFDESPLKTTRYLPPLPAKNHKPLCSATGAAPNLSCNVQHELDEVAESPFCVFCAFATAQKRQENRARQRAQTGHMIPSPVQHISALANRLIPSLYATPNTRKTAHNDTQQHAKLGAKEENWLTDDDR